MLAGAVGAVVVDDAAGFCDVGVIAGLAGVVEGLAGVAGACTAGLAGACAVVLGPTTGEP